MGSKGLEITKEILNNNNFWVKLFNGHNFIIENGICQRFIWFFDGGNKKMVRFHQEDLGKIYDQIKIVFQIKTNKQIALRLNSNTKLLSTGFSNEFSAAKSKVQQSLSTEMKIYYDLKAKKMI